MRRGMSARFLLAGVMVAVFLRVCLPVTAIELGDPLDPKLKQAYIRLRFERHHPPEAVVFIRDSLQAEEKAVDKLAELAGDPRVQVRALVAVLLGEIGQPESAAPLWKLLQDESEYVRTTASGALVRLRRFVPVAVAVDGLRHELPEVRRLTAATLHSLGDEAAESALIDVLDDEDEMVRMEAARALGSCGTEAAVPSLIPLLHDPKVLVRTLAAQTLGQFRDPAVIPALLDATKDADWHVRARSIMSLAGVVGHDAAKRAAVTDVFISRLNEDEYALVRDRAADALAIVQDDKATAALVRAVASDNRDARFHAARAIINAKAVSALPQLAEYRLNPDPEVRLKIMEVFGSIGGEDQVPAIVEAVDDSDANVRMAAVSALRHMQKRSGAPALRAKTHDANPHVRAASARALGDLADQAALPELITLLRDNNGFVRSAAAESLGKLGDRSAVQPLVAVLAGERKESAGKEGGIVIGTGQDPLPEEIRLKETEEKIQVVEALGDLKSDDAVDPIVAHGLKAEDAALRAAAAVALGKIKAPRSVEPLQDAVRPYYEAAARSQDMEEGVIAGTVPETVRHMKENEARVRASVAWALGQLADSASTETLMKAEKDSNSLVRDAATEALAKISERQEKLATKQAAPSTGR